MLQYRKMKTFLVEVFNASRSCLLTKQKYIVLLDEEDNRSCIKMLLVFNDITTKPDRKSSNFSF